MYDLVTHREHFRQGNPPTLVEFLGKARYCQASDERDKIYALLGISSQTFGVTPDYDLSAPEVFTNSAREVILQTYTLDILSLVRRKPYLSGEGRNSELPSWAPDWRPDVIEGISLI